MWKVITYFLLNKYVWINTEIIRHSFDLNSKRWNPAGFFSSKDRKWWPTASVFLKDGLFRNISPSSQMWNRNILNGRIHIDLAIIVDLTKLHFNCSLSTTPIKYSSPSVCPSFCVCVCVCVCVCNNTKTQKMVSHLETLTQGSTWK